MPFFFADAPDRCATAATSRFSLQCFLRLSYYFSARLAPAIFRHFHSMTCPSISAARQQAESPTAAHFHYAIAFSSLCLSAISAITPPCWLAIAFRFHAADDAAAADAVHFAPLFHSMLAAPSSAASHTTPFVTAIFACSTNQTRRRRYDATHTWPVTRHATAMPACRRRDELISRATPRSATHIRRKAYHGTRCSSATPTTIRDE